MSIYNSLHQIYSDIIYEMPNQCSGELRSLKNDCLKADGNGSNRMNIFKKLVSIAITAVMMNRNKCLTLY